MFHAARQDVEIFHNLGQIPRPLFDTQVAAMAAGFGEQIAYDALVRQLLRIELDKSSALHRLGAPAAVRRPAQIRPGRRGPPGGPLPQASRPAGPRQSESPGSEDEMAALTDAGAYDIDPEQRLAAAEAPQVHAEIPGRLQGRGQAGASAPPSSATSRAAASSRTRRSTNWPRNPPADLEGFNRLRSVPKGFRRLAIWPRPDGGAERGPGAISRPTPR